MPPKRPNRVRKPSSRAVAATASQISPTASRAARAAVTEALVGADALARVMELDVSEVEEIDEDQGPAEPTEPPPAYSSPEPFTYTL